MPRKKRGGNLCPLSRNAKNVRKNRAKRTPEEIQLEQDKARMAMMALRSSLTPEQRAERNEQKRIQMQKNRRLKSYKMKEKKRIRSQKRQTQDARAERLRSLRKGKEKINSQEHQPLFSDAVLRLSNKSAKTNRIRNEKGVEEVQDNAIVNETISEVRSYQTQVTRAERYQKRLLRANDRQSQRQKAIKSGTNIEHNKEESSEEKINQEAKKVQAEQLEMPVAGAKQRLLEASVPSNLNPIRAKDPQRQKVCRSALENAITTQNNRKEQSRHENVNSFKLRRTQSCTAIIPCQQTQLDQSCPLKVNSIEERTEDQIQTEKQNACSDMLEMGLVQSKDAKDEQNKQQQLEQDRPSNVNSIEERTEEEIQTQKKQVCLDTSELRPENLQQWQGELQQLEQADSSNFNNFTEIDRQHQGVDCALTVTTVNDQQGEQEHQALKSDLILRPADINATNISNSEEGSTDELFNQETNKTRVETLQLQVFQIQKRTEQIKQLQMKGLHPSEAKESQCIQVYRKLQSNSVPCKLIASKVDSKKKSAEEELESNEKKARLDFSEWQPSHSTKAQGQRNKKRRKEQVGQSNFIQFTVNERQRQDVHHKLTLASALPPAFGIESNTENSAHSEVLPTKSSHKQYLNMIDKTKLPLSVSVQRSPLEEESDIDDTIRFIERRYKPYFKKPVKIKTPIALSVHRPPLEDGSDINDSDNSIGRTHNIGDKPKNEMDNDKRQSSSQQNFKTTDKPNTTASTSVRHSSLKCKKKVGIYKIPKLPPSAYMIWLRSNSICEKIKQENPNFNSKQIAVKAEQMWSALKDKSEWEPKEHYSSKMNEEKFRQYTANVHLSSGSSKGSSKSELRPSHSQKAQSERNKQRQWEQADQSNFNNFTVSGRQHQDLDLRSTTRYEPNTENSAHSEVLPKKSSHQQYLNMIDKTKIPLSVSVQRSPLEEESDIDDTIRFIERRYKPYFKKPVKIKKPIALSVHRPPLEEGSDINDSNNSIGHTHNIGDKPKNALSPFVLRPSLEYELEMDNDKRQSSNQQNFKTTDKPNNTASTSDRHSSLKCKKKVGICKKPKLPLSAYMIWLRSNSICEKIKQENSNFNSKQIAVKAEQMWSALEDKSEWEPNEHYSRKINEEKCRQYTANVHLTSGSSKGSSKSELRPSHSQKAQSERNKQRQWEQAGQSNFNNFTVNGRQHQDLDHKLTTASVLPSTTTYEPNTECSAHPKVMRKKSPHQQYLKFTDKTNIPLDLPAHTRPFEKQSDIEDSDESIERSYEPYLNMPEKSKISPAVSAHRPPLEKESDIDDLVDSIERHYKPYPNMTDKSKIPKSVGSHRSHVKKDSYNEDSYDAIQRRYKSYFNTANKRKISPAVSAHRPPFEKESDNDDSDANIKRRFKQYLNMTDKSKISFPMSTHPPRFEAESVIDYSHNSEERFHRTSSFANDPDIDDSNNSTERAHRTYLNIADEPTTSLSASVRHSSLKSQQKLASYEKPKLPLSAYKFWIKSNREKIKRDNPDLNFIELARKAAEIWKTMADKSVWKAKELKCRNMYEEACRQYARVVGVQPDSLKKKRSKTRR